LFEDIGSISVAEAGSSFFQVAKVVSSIFTPSSYDWLVPAAGLAQGAERPVCLSSSRTSATAGRILHEQVFREVVDRTKRQGRALARKMKPKRAHEAARDKYVGRFPPGLRWFARWTWSRRNE
jgi:hypothetical protein